MAHSDDIKPKSVPGAEPSAPVRIGVLGSGPAGLTSAIALEQYLPEGVASITLLDKNASATDYPGIEYGIQERACRAFERMGLLEQALARSNPANEISFYNARLDKHFRSIKPDPHYTRSVARQAFLEDLTGLLNRTSILREHDIQTITANTDRTVTLAGTAGSDKDGSEKESFALTFDVVVAADGIRSIARRTFFPEYALIHDSGFSSIYMLVEATAAVAPPGFLDRANSGRSRLVMGNFSTLAMFPLGQGRLALALNFDHANKARMWAQHGLPQETEWADIDVAAKKAIALEMIRDVRVDGPMLEAALDLVPDWNDHKIYVWSMHDTDPLPRPFAADANLIAIGDAAHAILPSIGMGASLAIEDGEVLADFLAKALISHTTPAELIAAVQADVFEPFTKARFPVWDDLMDRARKAAKQNFIDVGTRTRFAIGPQIPSKAASAVVSAVEAVANRLGV
jgi:salicylate hydroxylase